MVHLELRRVGEWLSGFLEIFMTFIYVQDEKLPKESVDAIYLSHNSWDDYSYRLTFDATCPSSNDLRLFGLWKNGVSGSVCGLI